ncbi:hypothetical protein BJ508DRAFT_372501 [Ascobolus immersus RN42]|uniref:Autophagy-related protein 29 n=1 Tax=Ascobolus immersus RN42 TaxID=1160509 RepID=A0A3N4IRA1_ASCIM|nr:hypothetical protein BJ508DRAFT_372501 [Ascobolus immersus RN42]
MPPQPASTPMSTTPSTAPPQFVIHLHLPIPRPSNFSDPPTISWTPAKEKLLQRHLASASHTTEINWDSLASDLDVTRSFLLRKAAWLFQAQLEQVKGELNRRGSKMTRGESSREGSAGMPMPMAGATGGENMSRANSSAGGSARREVERLRRQVEMMGKEGAGLLALLDQKQSPASASPLSHPPLGMGALPPPPPFPTANDAPLTPRRENFHPFPPTEPILTPTLELQQDDLHHHRSPSPSSSSSSSSDDDDAPTGPFRKPPMLSHHRRRSTSPLHSSDEEEPSFIPLSALKSTRRTTSTSTLREATPTPTTPTTSHFPRPQPPSPSHRRNTSSDFNASPVRRATNHDSSGAPSMGSSFSDLSDASISQSLLEEVYRGGGQSMAGSVVRGVVGVGRGLGRIGGSVWRGEGRE